MFPKLLIANRGEIACRVILTARRLGITTVAVHSEADANALHTALADESYYIGGARPEDSYLNASMILEAAEQSGALAIHPGYGFLSEDADFAAACHDRGFVFVGPPAEAIRAMGDKIAAKALMEEAGVPVVPGTHGGSLDGAAQGAEELRAEAERIGFPVLIKAAAGGGGRGMRLVDDGEDMEAAATSARREAEAAFGDGRLLLEKYLGRARHVEVQVLADKHGHTIHLYDRDCSVQRRHQKVIEEAPAPGLDADLRQAMGAAAVSAAVAVGYVGAGTIEFLLDADGAFYFMEMNTRLQVEHPVTEMITGLDLVEWQLRVAAGQRLSMGQDDVPLDGHAFEARLYAEDPARDFLPSAGVLKALRFPAGDARTRVDTGFRPGDRVDIHYDSLIAKLIVHGADRAQALERFRVALAGIRVAGPATNLDFLGLVAGHPVFTGAAADTGFVERTRDELLPVPGPAPERALALACLAVLERRRAAQAAVGGEVDPHSPWRRVSGWRLGRPAPRVVAFEEAEVSARPLERTKGDAFEMDLPSGPVTVSGTLSETGDLQATVGGEKITAVISGHGDSLSLMVGGACYRFALRSRDAIDGKAEGIAGPLTAPMPGHVIAVETRPGAKVRHGATVVVLEAMKMEHALTAPADGVVARVHCAVGDRVDEGAPLVSFETGKA